MANEIHGSCHCGNLTYRLLTEVPLSEIRSRACDCGFCRIHAARNWSDPEGSVTIDVADARALSRYRFALRTADFFVCRVCGAYLGAVLIENDDAWSTVNLRLSELTADEQPASYGAEDEAQRVARRKRTWTPTKIRFRDSDRHADWRAGRSAGSLERRVEREHSRQIFHLIGAA
jgi:hypothetical protein